MLEGWVVRSGLSEEATVGSVFCATGKLSPSGCTSACSPVSSFGVLDVGETPASGAEVVAGWLETRSTNDVG